SNASASSNCEKESQNSCISISYKLTQIAFTAKTLYGPDSGILRMLVLGYFKNRLPYCLCTLRKCFLAQFKLRPVEIDITDMIDGNEVNMRMGNFQTHYRNTD